MENKDLPHDYKSKIARDKTASALSMVVRNLITRDKNNSDRILKTEDILKILVVWNKGDAARGRQDKFDPDGDGKPAKVGIPTGGNESQEFIDNIVVRETLYESGHTLDWIIKHFKDLRVDKKDWGKDKTHPHYIYWASTDPDYVVEIREKDEILKSDWVTFPEILYRVRLGLQAHADRRNDREAFFFSHANNFIIPIFLKIHQATPEEIEAETDCKYQQALKTYQQHVTKALEENWDTCEELGLFKRSFELGLVERDI